jgi:hypothetical protein
MNFVLQLGSMCYPDLHEFPQGSLPAPTRMMNPVRRLPPSARLIAVGWLDRSIKFPRGVTDPKVVSTLLGLGDEFLIQVAPSCEVFACSYCTPKVIRSAGGTYGKFRPQSPRWSGHHLVRLDHVVYMCPSLLPHYVVVHGYRPPDVFQKAVLKGVFLADGDLIHTGEDCLEVALQSMLTAAELLGDRERADSCRARILERRRQLDAIHDAR